MKLLRVSDYFINIDLVQTARIEQDSIVLTISGESFRFSGSDALLISNWLSRFAIDLNRSQKGPKPPGPSAESHSSKDWEKASARGGFLGKIIAS